MDLQYPGVSKAHHMQLGPWRLDHCSALKASPPIRGESDNTQRWGMDQDDLKQGFRKDARNKHKRETITKGSFSKFPILSLQMTSSNVPLSV